MRLFKYVAYAIATVFAAATAYSAYRALDYIATTRTADGVVVNAPIGPHHPDIVFVDSVGNRITFTGSGDISLEVGGHARVRYRQEDPAHSARVDSFGSIWTTTLFLLVMAVLFFIAGIRNIMPTGWEPRK